MHSIFDTFNIRWLKISQEDILTTKLIFAPVADVNTEKKIELVPRATTESTSMFILPDLDFSKRDYIQEHYSVGEVLFRIGSWYAILLPAYGLAIPLVLLYYLYSISNIISDEENERYRKMYLNYLKTLVGKIKTMPDFANKHTLLDRIVNKGIVSMR